MPFRRSDQPQEPDSKRICIARIASSHGVKGLVKILPLGEDPALIELVQEYDITLKNPHGKYYLAEIDGINTREDADKLRGKELFIERDQLPALDEDEGEYYYEDLIGLKAINHNSDKEAGEVIAVHNFGAGELLEIRAKSGETYLLPFNDSHAPEVDLDVGLVRIIPLEGL